MRNDLEDDELEYDEKLRCLKDDIDGSKLIEARARKLQTPKDQHGNPLSPVEQISTGCSWGFAILIDLLNEHISMEEMYAIRASETGLLKPEYFDIMMWAALVGEIEIARCLWAKTSDPLRAALVASLVSRQVAVNVFDDVGHEAEKLNEHAKIYEDWAVGLLESCDEKEARALLLATDVTYPAGSHRSALEVATEDAEFACKAFLKHRHCKSIVQEVYTGFRMQEPPQVKEVVSDMHPVYSGANACEFWLNSEDEAKQNCQLKVNLDFIWKEVTIDLYTPRRPVKIIQDGDDVRSETVEIASWRWSLQWAEQFLETPRVKFRNHSLSSGLFLLLLSVQLCGYPGQGPAWMHRQGTFQSHKEFTQIGYEPYGMITNLEYVMAFWTLCRLVDEVKQMIRVGNESFQLEQNKWAYIKYFQDRNNLMELIFYFFILFAVGLRYYAEHLYDGDATPIWPAYQDEQMLDYARALYALAVPLGFYRYIEVLKLYESLGVLVITLEKMATDVNDWININLLLTIGFGVSFTVLLPGESAMSEFELDKPFYKAFRAILGDFDISGTYEYFSSATIIERPTHLIMPLLLLFYIFLATIILVNLLIAQMSERYTTVLSVAQEEWLYNRMILYKEYKDDRDPVPPPFNLIPLVYGWL
eukprot:4514846-Prymnesium_polylepis.1